MSAPRFAFRANDRVVVDWPFDDNDGREAVVIRPERGGFRLRFLDENLPDAATIPADWLRSARPATGPAGAGDKVGR